MESGRKKSHSPKRSAQPLHVVVHGHFYQPPRENPWLGSIDRQPGAAPHHDWNEKIERECYGPNHASRILDETGRIEDVVNNYEYLSFDFGPTLLSWLERHRRDSTYQSILDADRASASRLGGHGNAIAQVYNHMIMPLADPIDRRTQVLWGQADFRHRFGREAEGMWLSETAIDMPTARELVEAGIRFTVLAPQQARRIRRLGTKHWIDVSAGSIDVTRPYRLFPFPGDQKRYLDIFFYDADLARGVAFEHLLRSSDALGARLVRAAPRELSSPALVSIATDGESYGHHEPFGDMCLSYLFKHKLRELGMIPTNYAHFLSLAAPELEVEVKEPSAWSCSHGVGRWERDCGCSMGTPGYDQQWRHPLREGLDRLRDELRSVFLAEMESLFEDPWRARNEYISVVLEERSDTAMDEFLERLDCSAVDMDGRRLVSRLLESQRYAMLMYTSCGWFFDDVAGIEPVQNLRYALRAIDLAQPYTRHDLRSALENALEEAPCNHRGFASGLDVLVRVAEPARFTSDQVAAGYALEHVLVSDQTPLVHPALCPERIEFEPAIEPFQVHLVGEQEAWSRAHAGRILLRESPGGTSIGFEVLVLESGTTGAACLVRRIGEEPSELRAMLQPLAPAERAALLARWFGSGVWRLRDLPGDTADRIRSAIASSALEALAGRLETELLEQEDFLAELRRDGRQPPLLLVNLGKTVTEERLAHLARYVEHSDVDTFLDGVEETFLLASLAGAVPATGLIGRPLSGLFHRLVSEACSCWRDGELDRMVVLDGRIRTLLSLAEARGVTLDRSRAEELLVITLRGGGRDLQQALRGQGEERRAAELMLSLAERVNLSPRVVMSPPGA